MSGSYNGRRVNYNEQPKLVGSLAQRGSHEHEHQQRAGAVEGTASVLIGG